MCSGDTGTTGDGFTRRGFWNVKRRIKASVKGIIKVAGLTKRLGHGSSWPGPANKPDRRRKTMHFFA